MTIQFNTDNHIAGTEELRAPFEQKLSQDLSRFSERITRLEVHLNDENSHKERGDDKRCMLEARLEGRQPVAVTAMAPSHEQAVQKAVQKLKAMLTTIVGRKRNY
jgi:hypothetical protein